MQASAGGRLVGHDDTGTGIPLLLLHAFPLSRRMWKPQLTALAGRARCIALDHRGFGESDGQPPHSIDRYADDAIALLDALGVKQPVVVCGLSLGGYIAFALWRRHPERLRALILADTRAAADTAEGRARRQALIDTVRTRGSGAIAEQQARALLSPRTIERCPEKLGDVQALIAAQSADAIVGASEAMLARPDSTPTLSTISVPTLIIVGEDDAVTPPADADIMHRAIRGSRLERIAGAGHLSSLERPSAFNEVVAGFLASLE